MKKVKRREKYVREKGYAQKWQHHTSVKYGLRSMFQLKRCEEFQSIIFDATVDTV